MNGAALPEDEGKIYVTVIGLAVRFMSFPERPLFAEICFNEGNKLDGFKYLL